MKRTFVGLVAGVALLIVLLPLEGSAFTLTGTNINGFVAWDRGGDVVETFDLDPRLGVEATGRQFNFAAGLMFDVTYDPTYPGIHDVVAEPEHKWLVTGSVSGLHLPWSDHPLDLEFSHPASYGDFLGAAHHLSSFVHPHLPQDLYYACDVTWTSATTAIASFGLAGNLDPACLPYGTPDQFYHQFHSDAEFRLSVDPYDGDVPQDPIPEPMTMLLFGAGLAGLGVIRRKRAS